MTTEPKAEGGCTDVEVLRDILGDHPLPPRQREAVESAIRSLNAKAEGEAVGWVFQHDETGRMTFCPNDGVNTPEVFAELNPGYTFCSAAYTHPSPSAVGALVPTATLRWWRELATINPQDLVPRIDAMLAAAPQAQGEG